MTTDPVLEALIAVSAFAIAADRYEEETGDTELAALMRIPGLEWELVGGKPRLRMEVREEMGPGYCLLELHCGTHDFGTCDVFGAGNLSLAEQIEHLLGQNSFGQELAPLFDGLVDEAMRRAWK